MSFRGAQAIATPMRVVMPRAPLPYYDGFSWFRYSIEDQDMARLAREIAERPMAWRVRSSSCARTGRAWDAPSSPAFRKAGC